MKNISLNFFGEEVSIKIPTDLASLRKEISDKFMFSPSDAAEIVLSYMKDIGKKIIQTEQDFSNFISNKIGKIDLDISPDSKLFLKNLNSLQKESEENKKELDLCLQKKDEIKKKKEALLKEEMAKIKEIEKKLKKLQKKKISLQKKMNEDKKIFENEEKENNVKINALKEKLGIKDEDINIIPKKTIIKVVHKNKKLRSKNVKKEKKENNEKKEEQKEIHTLVTCDGCYKSPIIGKRYKCECCPNFDFCEECYKKKKEKHGHSFKIVETKKLLKQIIQKFAVKTQNHEGKAIHQMYSCDGCGMNPIVGARFNCSICDNFDFCEKCEELYKNEHNHPFIKIYKPNMA